MTTYYVRSRADGEIINAVEANFADASAQDEFRARFNVDVFLDPNPPADVLKRYRFWDERP